MGSTHIDVVSKLVKTRERIVNVGPFSFDNESAVSSKYMVQVITAPHALEPISNTFISNNGIGLPGVDIV